MKIGERGQLQHQGAIVLDHRAHGRARRGKVRGDAAFGIELEFRPNVARRDDHLLQEIHFLFRIRIRPLRRGAREWLQGDRPSVLVFLRRVLRQPVPQLLGEKRHQGMQQPQRRLEHCKKIAPRRYGYFSVRVGHRRLHPLDIPIAEIAPEEVIDDVRGVMKTKILQRIIDPGDGFSQPRENPAVRQSDSTASRIRRGGANLGRGQFLDAHSGSSLKFLQIDEDESRRIPDFVGKGLVPRNSLFAQRDIRARRGFNGQRETQRVCAKAFHPLERVNDVAAHFGHLLSLRVQNERVQVERSEGNSLGSRFPRGEMQAEHDHARIPEKQNVVTADEQRRGIKRAKVWRIVGPAQRRERPKA